MAEQTSEQRAYAAKTKEAEDARLAGKPGGGGRTGIAAGKVDFGPSEAEKRDKQELDNAAEYDRPGILKRQAARKASAAPSPSPESEAKPASEPEAKPMGLGGLAAAIAKKRAADAAKK